VDVRIGITHTPKELEVEMPEDADRDTLVKDIEKMLESGDGVLWLTDRKGRRVGVPVVKVAYIEVGAPANERRVGFGASDVHPGPRVGVGQADRPRVAGHGGGPTGAALGPLGLGRARHVKKSAPSL
jgi:hypothetical protein